MTHRDEQALVSNAVVNIAQSAGTVEYTGCISEEG